MLIAYRFRRLLPKQENGFARISWRPVGRSRFTRLWDVTSRSIVSRSKAPRAGMQASWARGGKFKRCAERTALPAWKLFVERMTQTLDGN